MKYSVPVLLIIIALTTFSCNDKTSASIENTSPNGQVKVKVQGQRSNVLDAFKTEISVTAYDFKEGKLIFNIMAGDLNAENVKFNWQDDNNCIITIEERDKHVRSFKLIANEMQVQLAEI
jgi:hypothetical protein